MGWLCSHCQMNVKHDCQMAQTWWLRKQDLDRDGILYPIQPPPNPQTRCSNNYNFLDRPQLNQMFDLLLFQTNILSNQSTSTLTLNMVNFDIKKLQLHKQNFTNKRCKYESLKFPIVMKRRIHQKWVIVRNKQNFLILILPTSTATSKMYCFNFFFTWVQIG